MSYYRAPSLKNLYDEINKAYPSRSRASDGWIGDARHSARKSDHNPNSRCSVNAMDITAKGIDVNKVIQALIKHPSTNYVIHNRQIWSRVRGFTPVRYTGSNPHVSHIHISILQTKSAETDDKKWLSSGTTPAVVPSKPVTQFPAYKAPVMKYSKTPKFDPRLKVWQTQMLKRGWRGLGKADGYFGKKTLAVAKAFQKEKKLVVDGKIGKVTWDAAWLEKVTK